MVVPDYQPSGCVRCFPDAVGPHLDLQVREHPEPQDIVDRCPGDRDGAERHDPPA